MAIIRTTSAPARPVAAPELALVPTPVSEGLAVRPSVGRLVARPRLLDALVQTDAPLVVLHAPAGYGKTALLTQWDEADEREFVWIALDDPRTDPVALADEVLRQLGHRSSRVLVLDGAQALSDPEVLGLVADVALRQEPGCAIAMAMRGEPAIPLGLLRVRDAVLELGQEELALTTAEAEEVLRAAGLELGLDELETLSRCGGGWPAGVRLAALAVRGQPDLGAAVNGFGGDDRFVVDYLRDTVLAGLSPSDLAFMRHSASLGELSGPLCDAVLEREGSAELLRTLARSDRLVAAVDRAERKFRLHPLLAGMLSAELERCEPDLERRLHGRASAWHGSEGDVPRALEHAVAAGDAARAGELLSSVACAYSTGGRNRELRSWLQRVGDPAFEAQPALSLGAAVERLAAGDRDSAERWADVAERDLAGTPDSPHGAGLGIVRAGLARGSARRLLADAEHARELAGDGEWRGSASLLEGVAHRMLGDPESARERLTIAARRDGSETSTVRALALSLLARLELERNDADVAHALVESALHGTAALGLDDEPCFALVYASAGCARAHAGRIEQARQDVDRARRLLAAQPDPAPWYVAETSIALACALLRLSDSVEARELLSVAGRCLRGLPDAVGLHAALDAAWERADSFALDAIAGPSALTIAELRVLRFLPTHLSFREIAGRLHVSANTVKTQAHAVYRKLDASSRSEAVDRAATIGLIDP